MTYCPIILRAISISIFIAFRSIGSSCRIAISLRFRLFAVCPQERFFCIFLVIIGYWSVVALVITCGLLLTSLPFGLVCPLLIFLAIFELERVSSILALFISYRPRFSMIFQ